MKKLLLFATAACALAAVVTVGDDWAASKGGTFVHDKGGHIVEANMQMSWISDSDLQILGALPDLTRLDLSHTRVTDFGFGALKPLRKVTDLNLYYAELVGDGALASIKDWTRLRRLNLRGTKVTDAGLAHLAGLTSLEDLDIGYALITDGGFDRISALSSLKSLSVGGNKITDAGLTGLRLLPQLTRLDVSGAQRTDSGLWSASVTDPGLDTMASLKTLQALNLSGTKITDVGFPKLAALTELRELNLAQTQLSAKGLVALPRLRKLEKLSLFKAERVNDDAIASIAALPDLTWVDLQGTKVTKEGIAKLRAAHPKCQVLSGQSADNATKPTDDEP